MSQKIVIISGTFFPHRSHRSHRATELAKELVRRQGNDVTLAVILGEYDYLLLKLNPGTKLVDLGVWKLGCINSNRIINVSENPNYSSHHFS